MGLKEIRLPWVTILIFLCEAEELVEAPTPAKAAGSAYTEGVKWAAGTEVTGPVEVVLLFEDFIV